MKSSSHMKATTARRMLLFAASVLHIAVQLLPPVYTATAARVDFDAGGAALHKQL
jgi:hypothetical protein